MLLTAVVLLTLSSTITDTARHTEVSGAVTVTTKGISLIPSITLGKPATIIDIGIDRAGFGFEPQFKVGLDGRPWAFIFWGRYRPNTGDRFHLVVGAHPAIQFHSALATIGGTPRSVTTANRYFVTELWPSVSVTKNIGTGVYWLDGHGLDRDASQHAHFVCWRSSVNVPLANRFFIFVAPQTYYLWQDRREGTYANAAATLGRRSFPVTLTAMENKALHSTIVAQDMLWNVSLTYSIR
jgi:hypothetical protein